MTVEIPANIYGLTDEFKKIKIADAVVTAETVDGTISSIDNTADGVYQFFDADGNPIYDVRVGDRPYACRTIVPGSKVKYHIQPDPVLPAGASLVGGTIFYIDDTADGAYEFFDIDGNVINNVGVGDAPYSYRVTTSGSKDKYYVYHDEIYNNLRWTYYKDGAYADEYLGLSDMAVGAGKPNTETVMTTNNGVYITADSNGYPTIWYQLQQVRNAKVGGCDDWFVPSPTEAENLRLTIKSGAIAGGTIAGSSYNTSVFANSCLWSSVKPSSSGIIVWDPEDQNWLQNVVTVVHSVLFTRAF